MSQAINRYKADLRDMQFVLFEQFGLGDLLGKEPFGDWGPDEVRMVLDESYRFVTEVLGPLNATGDRQGCTLKDGKVTTPEGFDQAWKKLYEAGWKALSVHERFGGQGAPLAVAAAVEEMLSGSNTAFNMYPGLAAGAADVIAEFGTERQQSLYAKRMFAGTWGGTMCLTEPQAGSDVGAATTSAEKNDDGTYSIQGTKAFITGGDHDLADNIIHLVLARIKGAAPGTKGLSLFVVPKVRVSDDGTLGELNDVQVASIEHKMGINGSSTCLLNFGDDGKCVGELIGTVEHQGIRQMFKMMNFARIAVGIQGLALGSSAYLNALQYAKERRQGPSIANFKDPEAPKVPILEHPNVREMLMEMKGKVEGIRALIYKLAVHQDRADVLKGKDDDGAAYHSGQVDLLVPLVKAYASDEAFRVCELAIQVYGGAGYLRDHPIEQYCRDAKIFSIYEGTNSIQALDLVGRQLGRAGGKHTQEFFGDIVKFTKQHKAHPDLGPSVKLLAQAQEAVAGTTMQFLQWVQKGEMDRMPLVANAFLAMMSELSVGWLLLDAAAKAIDAAKDVASDHPDQAFYAGKKHVAIWFSHHVLGGIPSAATSITSGDRSAIEIPDEAFATV